MLYKLLGFVVWKGAKQYMRSRYGPPLLPRSALAAIVLIGIGALVAASRRRASAES